LLYCRADDSDRAAEWVLQGGETSTTSQQQQYFPSTKFDAID
jgi:hypothetical protein